MNLKLKVVFSIMAVVSLALAMTPGVALAATSGQTPGSFSCGNATPVIGDPVPSNPVITPNVSNNISIPISDPNTIADIDSVTVHIFFDPDGVYNASEMPPAGPADTQTYAILTWTPSTGWTIEPSPSTWAIDVANCSAPSNTSTSGNLVFAYIPGTVATETASNPTTEWQIFVEVTDGSNTDTSFAENLEMAWYGAVTVIDPVSWGTVLPGMNYGEDTASEVSGIDVNYVCNGLYDEKVAASSIWTGALGNASLDFSEAVSGANQFSLRADDDGTFTDAIVVNTAPSNYTAIDTTGTITEEAGDLINTNSIWLKLSANFAADTYNGSIYYQIAQRY